MSTRYRDPLSSREIDKLYVHVYEDLKRMARSVRGRGDGDTLNATALVNEAYFKLRRSGTLTVEGESHFKRIAIRALRQVMVEAARRRNAEKRGGGVRPRTLNESCAAEATPRDLIALDEALRDLAKLDPRQAEIVQLRFFGELSETEVARHLGISRSTVQRDWRFARASLLRLMSAASEPKIR